MKTTQLIAIGILFSALTGCAQVSGKADAKASTWPDWPKQADSATKTGTDGKPSVTKTPSKPSPMSATRPANEDAATTPAPESAAIKKATGLFQAEIAEANRLRGGWLALNAQIPVQIPRGASADYYEQVGRLVGRTREAKKDELKAWAEYYLKFKQYWQQRLQRSGGTEEERRTALASAAEMLAVENAELADIDRRLGDLINAASTDAKPRQELEGIRTSKLQNIADLNRAIDEFKNGIEILDLTKLHAERLIGLTVREERSNAIEHSLWEAIYGGRKALIDHYADIGTQNPEPQPKGDK